MASANAKVLNLLKKLEAESVDAPLSLLIVFYTVVDNGRPMGIQKIAAACELPYPTVVRCVAALDKWGSKGREGLSWFTTEEDPANRRRKLVTVTAKGKAVVSALKNIIE